MGKYDLNSFTAEDANDDEGCITGTRQCGPCMYNRTCTQSTRMSVQEPSASDWRDPDCLPRIERELRFD